MLGSKILLVEDDASARELLAECLTRHGFQVSTLASGEHTLEALSRDDATLVLLDVELPGESGLSVCKRLRASGWTVPVIMVTGRGDVVDRILGLEVGADDYLVKPFDSRELLARIGVQLRRYAQRTKPNEAVTCRFGPYELDTGHRTLTRSGRKLLFTRAEFAILEVFARHPNEPLARERIYKLTHRRSFVTSPRSVDVQIARLRRLLEDDTTKPRYIHTIWGVGYVFLPDAAT